MARTTRKPNPRGSHSPQAQARRILVRCDLEGASGIVSYDQVEPGKRDYDLGQHLFMSDLLALLAGLSQGGADEILVYDEHTHGRNIDITVLDENVTAICGKPPYRADWPGGLTADFAGVVLLGFHAKYGTPDAVLHHSYELDIRDLRLNGVSVGEIGMEAAIAGDVGVPVILVTGDSKGVAEARELLPGVQGVVVKESLSAAGARCYPGDVTAAWIATAAAAVVQEPPAVKPWRVEPPVRLEIELNEGAYRRAVRRLYHDDMTDRHTLVLSGPSVTAVWAEYWARKLHAQAVAASLA